MKKYKPIRIHHLYYGYGYWWGSYFFFIGKHSTVFAIVPMYMECHRAAYASNGHTIGHGDTLSWSESRQFERKEQEERDYYKQMEEYYYKQMEDDLLWN